MRIKRATLFGLLILISAAAQADAQVGGWVSANATSITPATDNIRQVAIFRVREENFDTIADYSLARRPSFDIGGGIRFGAFGAGVAMSRHSGEAPAGVSIAVPHPLLFNRRATASGTTQDPIQHSESALHLEGRYIANLPRFSVSVFAGPSHIRSKQGLVTDVVFRETLNLATLAYAVNITGVDTETEDDSAWGYNLGADLGYYFSNNIGVGALVRFSRATVALRNPLESVEAGSVVTQDVEVGGLQYSGGFRLRF